MKNESEILQKQPFNGEGLHSRLDSLALAPLADNPLIWYSLGILSYTFLKKLLLLSARVVYRALDGIRLYHRSHLLRLHCHHRLVGKRLEAIAVNFKVAMPVIDSGQPNVPNQYSVAAVRLQLITYSPVFISIFCMGQVA